MKSDLIIFFLSFFFRHIPFLKDVHRKYSQKLRTNYGFDVSLIKIGLRNINALQVDNLCVSYERYGMRLNVQKLVIKLALLNFRPVAKRFHFDIEEVCLEMLPKSVGGGQHSQADVIAKLKWVSEKLLTVRLPNLPIDSLNCRLTSLTILADSERRKAVEVTEMVFAAGRFSLRAESIRYGKLNLKNIEATGSILYSMEHVSITFDTSFGFIVSSGEISNIQLVNAGFHCQIIEAVQSRKLNMELSVPKVIVGKSEIPDVHENCEICLVTVLSPSEMILLPESRISIDGITARLFFRHVVVVNPTLTIKATVEKFSILQLLKAFPRFNVKSLYTAEFVGEFGLTLELDIALAGTKNYTFNISVDNNLALPNRGDLDLHFLNGEFKHIPCKGREIILGERSPSFTRLNDIPKYLKDAIIHCEDRFFYQHHLVDIQGVGLAIVRNMSTGKLLRGGSSISMQLVKNLFLTHTRSIERKAEELLLTWLIEDVFEISKDRILELYLNLIEFAPGYYGVKEAAQFYFSKNVQSLSYTEAIVLTYIIPRPKYFLHALKDNSAILVENLSRHIKTTASEMYQRGLVSDNLYRTISTEIDFCRPFGKLKLNDPLSHLHPTLKFIFKESAKYWASQYPDQPRPVIVKTFRNDFVSTEGVRSESVNQTQISIGEQQKMNPHQFLPSLAFDVQFRDNLGNIIKHRNLYDEFSKVLQMIDRDNEVSRSGNDLSCGELAHFELRIWQSIANVED